MDLHPLHMPQAKQCNTCKQLIDRAHFGKDKYRPDRQSDRCLPCRRKEHAIWRAREPAKARANTARWKAANPEHIAQYAATHKAEKHNAYVARYARDKDAIQAQQSAHYFENKDVLRPARTRWERNNKEKRKAQRAADHLAHPEKRRKRHAAWLLKNPGYSTAQWRKRDALIRGATYSDLSDKQFEEICQIQRQRCYYCGVRCKGQLTRDHIVPVTKGGPDTIQNIVAVCRSCNSIKGDGNPPIPVQMHLLTEAPPRKKRATRTKKGS